MRPIDALPPDSYNAVQLLGQTGHRLHAQPSILDMPPANIRDKFEIHPDVVWREIDGEVVLLNVVTGLYYGLDEVGSSVWRLLAGKPATLDVVRDGLLTEFETD